jgi:hypothetical protein
MEYGQPKEIKPIIDFKYYQPPRPPMKDKGPDLSNYLVGPMANPMGMPYLNYPSHPYFGAYSRPSFMMAPIVKNITISTDGPTAHHQRLAMIYEDALPAKPFIPLSTTVGERLNIYQFIRSSIFSNADGEDISLDGTQTGGGPMSLLSFIKFGDLNPFNTYKLSDNIYKGMPFGYLIYRSCYPIRESSGMAMCAKNSTGVNVRIYRMLEGSFLVNRINSSLFPKYDEWREVAFYEYIRENIIKKKMCPHFITLYGYFISEKCGIDFDAIELAKDGSKTVNVQQPIYRKTVEETEEDKECDKLKNIADNFLEGIVNENVLIKTNMTKQKPGKVIKYTNSSNEIVEINPDAYLGKTLVLLTESPTYNLIGWATKTYQQSGNVKEMVNRGIHTELEWMNIYFQLMVALYVMQLNKIFIKNFSVENNVMIKDLTVRGAITNFWKYKVDEMDFYLPNLGYLVLIDSNFKDLDNNTATKSESTFNKIIKNEPMSVITNTNKVDGKFLGENICKLTDSEINSKVFEMFINAFNTNVFDKESDKSGLCKPPSEIMDMLGKIHAESISDKNEDVKYYITKYMSKFLHNRVGTYLREAETLNIRRDDTREFKRGQLVVYEDGYGTFKFVVYLDTDNGKAKILTKNDPSDSDIIENECAISRLLNYSRAEPISQNYKPNEANLNEEDMLETYVIKN